MVSLLSLYPTLSDVCGLPSHSQLEGKSLMPLIRNPRQLWDKAVAATIGRGNHSISTKRWRYIRYFDGTEELYDHHSDQHEWFNLAGDSRHDGTKKDLAQHAPTDPKIKQFVRAGRYKAVVAGDESMMLFDILAPMGISEQTDVAQEHPNVVSYIRDYLEKSRITTRHVTIPELP
jgi:arylsulfatase A-like enzyme